MSAEGSSKSNNNQKEKKKKKTKLEKIYELEGQLKVVKEDNRRLKKEINSLRIAQGLHTSSSALSNNNDGAASVLSDFTDLSEATNNNNNDGTSVSKLKEALKSLKRVTVQQEKSIVTLRQKSSQRRKEISSKNRQLETLQQQVEAYKVAHDKILRDNKNSDASSSSSSAAPSRVAELELQLAQSQGEQESQTKQIQEQKDEIKKLKQQLERQAQTSRRQPSTASLKSTESITDEELIAKLRKELASKRETIVKLEFDLETAQDEIHELKESKKGSSNGGGGDISLVFPETPAPGTDDFFSDDEDDDDFWGTS